MGGDILQFFLPDEERKLFDIRKILPHSRLRVALAAQISRIRRKGLGDTALGSRRHRLQKLRARNLFKLFFNKERKLQTHTCLRRQRPTFWPRFLTFLLYHFGESHSIPIFRLPLFPYKMPAGHKGNLLDSPKWLRRMRW